MRTIEDIEDRRRRDPLARRTAPPPAAPIRWLVPAILVLLLAGVLAAVVVVWMRHVPIVPMRQRPPVELSDIPPAIEPSRLMPIAPEVARSLNEKRPIDLTGPLPAVSRFQIGGSPLSRSRAIACLAAAAWYEAGDDASGARAVVQTVLNRARHPAFRPSICGVVFQGSERATGCQFTFTCDRSLQRTPSPSAWARATAVATMMIDGDIDARVGAATHYHADYVLPYWAPTLLKLSSVGRHIFYTWPGRWGSPASLSPTIAGEEPAIAAMVRLSAAHRADPSLPAAEAASTAPIDPTAPAPPPPVGIGDRPLRGAVVRSAQNNDGRFFIQVDGGAFPGNHAVAALALCRTRARCRVYGWSDAAAVASALPLSDAASAALTFFYAHDDGQTDRALWNCAQISRANQAQCLPAAPAARRAVTD